MIYIIYVIIVVIQAKSSGKKDDSQFHEKDAELNFDALDLINAATRAKA